MYRVDEDEDLERPYAGLDPLLLQISILELLRDFDKAKLKRMYNLTRRRMGT